MTELLWNVPNKPDNISTGRNRITSGLERRGYDVTVTADRKDAAKQIIAGKPDVVVSTTAAGGVLVQLCKVRRIPYIMDYVDPVTQMYRSSDRKTAMLAHGLRTAEMYLADAIVCVYDEEVKRIPRWKDVHRTTLGVDYDRFADPKQNVVRQACDLLDECDIPNGYTIYTGGLEPIYRLPAALRAAADDGWEFVIAGTGSEKAMVQSYARDYENIHYLGVVDHGIVPGLLRFAGVGLCLVDDPHTVKTLEYAASGIPIVQADGRARGKLPETGVYWTKPLSGSLLPTDVTAAVYAARRTGAAPTLRKWAKNHDYEDVITDYERAIEGVIA